MEKTYSEEIVMLKKRNKMENDRYLNDKEEEMRLTEEVSAYFEHVKYKIQNVSDVKAENEELRTLAQQKHNECESYYEKMQEMCKRSENMELKLRNAEEMVQRREQEIALYSIT